MAKNRAATDCNWPQRTVDSRCSSRSLAFQNTLHRSPIVPCGQSSHHAFPHRSLQFSVLLQLTLALQFHFLALAGSYSRSFERDLLPTEDHAARLLSPAHTACCGIGPMRRSYSARLFVFQDGAQDLQSGLPGQLFYLRLHLGHTSAIGNGTRTGNSCRTCDWTCALSSGNSFSRWLSPLKRDSQSELYPRSGESRCFLFSSFQLNPGHPLRPAVSCHLSPNRTCAFGKFPVSAASSTGVPRQNSGRVLSFTPLTMLQASAQAVDFKVGRHFGEGQALTSRFWGTE
jgi:hypothetical protein